MKPRIAAGNWKMHGSRQFIAEYVSELADHIGAAEPAGLVLLIPPSGYLGVLAEALEQAGLRSKVSLGGQNLHQQAQGAFTGEISGEMLVDLGAEWVLVGHSERREYALETDEVVAEKTGAALRAGLKPILCIGETESERDAGQAEAVVVRQLTGVLADHAEGLAAVAYEPVWAIGTGKTATPELAQAMHQVIRETLAGYSASLATRMPVLYGGSVKAENAATLFARQDIDGGLVGGASLKAREFAGIIRALGA